MWRFNCCLIVVLCCLVLACGWLISCGLGVGRWTGLDGWNCCLVMMLLVCGRLVLFGLCCEFAFWVCVRLLWFVLFWVYWFTVIVCDFRLSLVCSLHLVAAVVSCGCSCCVGIWLVYCFLVACCLSGVVPLVLLFRALLRCVHCGGLTLDVDALLYCCGCCVYYLCCLVVWVVWFLGLW